MQTLMEGCGTAGLPYMTSGMRMLILDSLRHQNRSVTCRPSGCLSMLSTSHAMRRAS